VVALADAGKAQQPALVILSFAPLAVGSSGVAPRFRVVSVIGSQAISPDLPRLRHRLRYHVAPHSLPSSLSDYWHTDCPAIVALFHLAAYRGA
jgi:hypothetical protein